MPSILFCFKLQCLGQKTSGDFIGYLIWCPVSCVIVSATPSLAFTFPHAVVVVAVNRLYWMNCSSYGPKASSWGEFHGRHTPHPWSFQRGLN